MRTATRLVLVAFAFVLAAGSAGAQNDVTFQVDLGFCPTDVATDSVLVRGSFNDWSNDPDGDGDGEPTYTLLTDADGDGDGRVYTGTASLPTGEINYKFYGGTPETENDTELGYESGDNRTYTVTAGAQTLDLVEFRSDSCVDPNAAETFELTFVVDMTVPIARGDLDTEAGEIVAVAGSFTGWENEAFQLTPESDNPNIYTGSLVKDLAPGDQFFKFVIRTPKDGGGFDTSYENPKGDVSPLSNGNRTFTLTGDEPTDGTTGNLLYAYDNDDDENNFVSYSDADASSLLTDAATVTFVIDLRPAFYAFADSSSLPGGITDADLLDDAYVNGPIFGESDGVMEDWATWSAEGLGETRQLAFNAADSTASITLSYSAGAFNLLAGKFSIGGADNESGFGGDKFVRITEGEQTINLIFGAQNKADGTIEDSNDSFGLYDPYIFVNNGTYDENGVANATAMVVRRGGNDDFAVANEAGPGRAGALALGAVYPNPTTGLARIEVSVGDEAVSVSVYDVTGRRVATVLDDVFVSGVRVVEIDTESLSSGIYVVRAASGNDVATRRLTVVR